MTDTPTLLATEAFYAGDSIGLVQAGDPVDLPDGPERDALLEAGLLRPAPPDADPAPRAARAQRTQSSTTHPQED